MMDDHSYDDTEPTPEPMSFRPPARSQQPLPTIRTTPNASILEHSLFSYSIDGTIDDDVDASLPSLTMEPPSPMSKISASLFCDDQSSSVMRRRQRKIVPPSLMSKASSTRRIRSPNQQPPIDEVRLDNSSSSPTDNDTFFECFEDRSLAQRTKKTLGKSPQKNPVNQQIKRNYPISSSIGSVSVVSSIAEEKHEDESSLPSPNNNNNPNDNNPSSEEMARVQQHALKAIMLLKGELLKAKQRNQTLEQATIAQTNNSSDWQLQQEQRVIQVQRSMTSLQETNTTLENQNVQLLRERDEYNKEKQQLELKARMAMREKKEHMHRKLASDNRHKDLKGQLQKLKAELEQTMAAKVDLASDLALAQAEKEALETQNTKLLQQVETVQAQQSAGKDAESQIQQLGTELKSRDTEVAQIKTTMEQANETHQAKNAKLQKELENAAQTLKQDRELYQQEMERLKAAFKSRPSLKSPTTPAKRMPSTSSFGGVRFEASASQENENGAAASATLETSIADRLARMRDSAERAHLIKAHKRDLARLQMDKESEIQKLKSSHDDALRKAHKQADSKLSTKLEQVQTSLQEDYDEQLQEVESRNHEKFAELQKQYMRSQEEADESLQSALSKFANITQQCEREVARRAATEKSMDHLNHQIDAERTQLLNRHAEELEKRRSEWEMERDTLLTVIQQDCNSAFDRRRSDFPKSPSVRPTPTAVDTDYFSKLTVDTSLPTETSSPRRTPPTTISPAYSDIDSVLRETEDLIQSIM